VRREESRSAVVRVVGWSCVALAVTSPRPGAAQQEPYRDSALSVAERADDLLGRMTLQEKIGQMTQVDRQFLETEDDISGYFLGSLLSGGGSAPDVNEPEAWADMYDRYQQQALGTRLGIPLIYGIDAVHGHNNVRGAVIFPHNIGLGATRDPELVREVARITAREMAATGIDWNFGPCLAVPRDERWGRTYEGFGEDPALVAELGAAAVRGYQGDDLGAPETVLATAKHYFGDGGTKGGKDRGDVVLDEALVRRIHLAGYPAAFAAGAGSVMASFSSWNGQQMHGNRSLLTDLLRGELGFEGLVVSDWEAIDLLPGDYPEDVRQSIDAGIDMVMVPQHYQTFVETLTAQVEAGKIAEARIDEAVRRILEAKLRLGLFEHPFADRTLLAAVGSAEHRAVARQAVRESLVVLQNDGGVLPLERTGHIVVGGANADDIGNQSGGWTITWQGESGPITEGTTILDGIRAAAGDAVEVTHSPDGTVPEGATLGIAVIGETPYAEWEGDREDLHVGAPDLAVVEKLHAAGIPVVVVLVAGRPRILGDVLEWADAVVVAWLPGSEGGGVADVLFGDYAPTGKLPVSWPAAMEDIPLNADRLGPDTGAEPLFAYGFGLGYSE